MTKGEPYDKGIRKNQLSGNYGDFEPVHVASDGDRYPTDVIYIKTAESEGAVFTNTEAYRTGQIYGKDIYKSRGYST